MARDNVSLSLHHAKLIIGFTHNTLTEAQSDELDEWVCESDQNLDVFEMLLEAVDSKRLSLDEIIMATEGMVDLWVVAGLMARQLQGVIEPEQKKQLAEWVASSNQNRKVYNLLRSPANLHTLLLHLLQHSGENLSSLQVQS